METQVKHVKSSKKNLRRFAPNQKFLTINRLQPAGGYTTLNPTHTGRRALDDAICVYLKKILGAARRKSDNGVDRECHSVGKLSQSRTKRPIRRKKPGSAKIGEEESAMDGACSRRNLDSEWSLSVSIIVSLSGAAGVP